MFTSKWAGWGSRWYLVICVGAFCLAGCNADVSRKNSRCAEDKECEQSEVCQGGKCRVSDDDKDGWAKGKDCNDSNRDVFPGAPEICGNKADDNCDGKIDEEPCLCQDGAVRACGTDVGECRQGQQTCVVGEWGKCLGQTPPVSESCDGKDNDCDGSIDEEVPNCCTPGKSQPCGSDVGECKKGTQKCNDGQWTSCEGEVGPQDEDCDGKDNDCDGKIVETKGKGECKGGTQSCKEGQWQECTGQTVPQEEDCDGKDNDCDGKIDNFKGEDRLLVRSCYSGPAETKGKGICKDGIQQCVAGAWGNCQGEVKPTAEVCNGIDDDCDGQVDNAQGASQPLSRPCYTGPAHTRGKGACKEGAQACNNGHWKSCQNDIRPSPEKCNGLDDDCDGQVDNLAGSSEPLSGPCYSGPAGTAGVGICKSGSHSCQQGKWGPCKGEVTPQKEVCDNKDNDCDGRENNVPGKNEPLGQPCYTGPQGTQGVGTCQEGVHKCVGGQWSSACTGQITPQPESCDGKDNDCDGKIDNMKGKSTPLSGACYSGPAGTRGNGLCQDGTHTCKNGKWGPCVGEVLPQTESCDSKDNDCDGRIDNVPGQSAPLTTACYTGPTNTRKVGACKDGARSCKNGRWSTSCDGEVKPQPEDCNGQDDDCDGRKDNKPGSTTPLGGACYSGPAATRGKGICQDGSRTCVSGKWSTCSGEITPRSELCNSKDDDCDGSTDEGNPQGGASCTVSGRYGLCRVGQMTCSSGRLQCKQVTFPKTETCNNKDDDCDNRTDEGLGDYPSSGGCSRGQRCSLGRCVSCSQPSDRTCSKFLGVCTSSASCPSCKCGYTCYCKSKDIFGTCERRSCR